jgi:hypothetical protein
LIETVLPSIYTKGYPGYNVGGLLVEGVSFLAIEGNSEAGGPLSCDPLDRMLLTHRATVYVVTCVL